MKIYENRNNQSPKNRCSYCREPGHNKFKCPEVDKDWAWWSTFTVPPYSTGWKNRNHPKYWGDWYTECKETWREKERRKNQPKVAKKRSLPKCGFCGGDGHNRRQCSDMEIFRQKCYDANENWRKAAYKELVEKHGICVGACVEVVSRNYGNSSVDTKIALITAVNFDSLNVMAALSRYYAGNVNPYECSLSVKVLIDDKETEISVLTSKKYKHDWQSDLIVLDGDIIVDGDIHYYSYEYLGKVISPSEFPLDESWITDYKGAFDLLLKKRSLKQLKNDGIISLIEEWSKKD